MTLLKFPQKSVLWKQTVITHAEKIVALVDIHAELLIETISRAERTQSPTENSSSTDEITHINNRRARLVRTVEQWRDNYLLCKEQRVLMVLICLTNGTRFDTRYLSLYYSLYQIGDGEYIIVIDNTLSEITQPNDDDESSSSSWICPWAPLSARLIANASRVFQRNFVGTTTEASVVESAGTLTANFYKNENLNAAKFLELISITEMVNYYYSWYASLDSCELIVRTDTAIYRNVQCGRRWTGIDLASIFASQHVYIKSLSIDTNFAAINTKNMFPFRICARRIKKMWHSRNFVQPFKHQLNSYIIKWPNYRAKEANKYVYLKSIECAAEHLPPRYAFLAIFPSLDKLHIHLATQAYRNKLAKLCGRNAKHALFRRQLNRLPDACIITICSRSRVHWHRSTDSKYFILEHDSVNEDDVVTSPITTTTEKTTYYCEAIKIKPSGVTLKVQGQRVRVIVNFERAHNTNTRFMFNMLPFEFERDGMRTHVSFKFPPNTCVKFAACSSPPALPVIYSLTNLWSLVSFGHVTTDQSVPLLVTRVE